MTTTYRKKCGKKEVHINWSTVIPAKAALVTGTTLKTTGHVPADSRQYVCMYGHHIYVCMYAYMYVCMYVWSSHICMYVCIYVCRYGHHIYVCMYVWASHIAEYGSTG